MSSSPMIRFKWACHFLLLSLLETIIEKGFCYERKKVLVPNIPQKSQDQQPNTHDRVKGMGVLPQWVVVGFSGRHGASVPSDYSQGTGRAR